jgi:aminoglycoside 6'-N-acetyltransferase I
MSRASHVRPLTPSDRDVWLALRLALWPGDASEHVPTVDSFLAGDRTNPAEVLLAVDADGAPIGFAELSLRSWAEGCRTTPVCYLEGWYVDPAHRRRGVGGSLVRAAEAWGHARGAREMASDADLDNATSHAAHRALGFDEVGRAVLYRRSLSGSP